MFFSQLSQLADTGLGRLQQIKNDFEAHVESSLGLDHANTVLGTNAGAALSHPCDQNRTGWGNACKAGQLHVTTIQSLRLRWGLSE